MSAAPTLVDLDADENSAPPRANGELVFAEPWESRAFGMAVTLCEAGVFTWPQFQAALIARITRWEAAPAESAHWDYYQHWLGALEDVLAMLGQREPALRGHIAAVMSEAYRSGRQSAPAPIRSPKSSRRCRSSSSASMPTTTVPRASLRSRR